MLKKIFITVSCISCLLIFEAQANVYDYKTATWNLQGSSAATESKWNINVRAMVSGSQNSHAQILAVQEAGNVPASAVLMPQMNTQEEFYSVILVLYKFLLRSTDGTLVPPIE